MTPEGFTMPPQYAITKTMNYSFLPAALLLAMPDAVSAADLKLATVFSDHMVLQRETSVPVWGWADPDELVTVIFAGQEKTAKAEADGLWKVALDPLKTSQEPGTLTVKSSRPDRTVTIGDVLVGEVWLGSGQSNMAMAVSRALNLEKEKASANLPLIRMFKETSAAAKTPQADSKGRWEVCSPATVGTFSATLFFFGREVQRELGIPVGLINSSVGGTPIESWIAETAQASSPPLQAALAEAAKADAGFDENAAKAAHAKALARWQVAAEQAKAAGQPPPRKPVDPLEQRQRKGSAGGLFNGKIAPLIPFAIRGAVWYQGEANSKTGKGILYQHQLPLLIRDWRERWGMEFPFAWVQLPNFERPESEWMEVREGMLKTLSLPKTGMAITLDIGDPKDIHPKNKQEVGRRLSLWALGEVYEQKVASTSGPLPTGHTVKGANIEITFRHTEGGLVAKGGELREFVISGTDEVWKPAAARIEGEKVIVSSPSVPQPVAVRYAWKPNPEASLFNGAGLPASPFRTDGQQ